jgi:hypothetical protein
VDEELDTGGLFVPRQFPQHVQFGQIKVAENGKRHRLIRH